MRIWRKTGHQANQPHRQNYSSLVSGGILEAVLCQHGLALR